MSKYDIQDAYKLKVFMQEITEISNKYDNTVGQMYLSDIPEQLKQAIEFIAEMVEKNV